MKKTWHTLVLLTALLSLTVRARGEVPATADLKALVETARTAPDLAHLNDVRIRLRNIVFDSLASREDRWLYAEAYRELAWSFRGRHYIRPGYDLMAKYISLRDTLNEAGRRHGLDSLRTKYREETAALTARLKEAEATEAALKSDKVVLDGARSSYLVIRTLLVLLVLAVFAVVLVRLRKRTARARADKDAHCTELLGLAEGVVRGQMTVGLLYHAGILNSRIQEETTRLSGMMPPIEKEFAGVKETRDMLKGFKDNLARILKLVELNRDGNRAFFEKMPVYRRAGEERHGDEPAA